MPVYCVEAGRRQEWTGGRQSEQGFLSVSGSDEAWLARRKLLLHSAPPFSPVTLPPVPNRN